jgi:hypothetical protein
MFVETMKFENWMIPKSAASWFFCHNFRRILSSLASVLEEGETRDSGEIYADSVEGIPTVELISLLFETGRLSTSDSKRFSISPARWSVLLSKLEEVGIMIRGEKNARVLNPEFSRSDVAKVLAGCEKAEDVKLRLSPSLKNMEKEMDAITEEPLEDAEKQPENAE